MQGMHERGQRTTAGRDGTQMSSELGPVMDTAVLGDAAHVERCLLPLLFRHCSIGDD